jgi:hypothetical protein
MGFGIADELLPLQVLFPECNGIVSEPIVLDALHIFVGQSDVVVGEVGFVWRELEFVSIEFSLAAVG